MSVVALVAAVAIVVGVWALADALLAQAVDLHYATMTAPPFVEPALTGWGWAAALIAAAGAVSMIAGAVWGGIIWYGFATGWTDRAVPIATPWAARAAGAAAGALATLVAVIAVGLVAPVGLIIACFGGYLAAEIAWPASVALTARALIAAALDPLLGWPAPGGWSRLHRVTMRGDTPIRVEARVGPGWSAGSITAVSDWVHEHPAAALEALIWGYDARRRLLIGVRDDEA